MTRSARPSRGRPMFGDRGDGELERGKCHHALSRRRAKGRAGFAQVGGGIDLRDRYSFGVTRAAK